MLIPDPARQWGAPDCPNCKGKCSGHFLAPDGAIFSPLKGMTKPPSVYIKEMFIINQKSKLRRFQELYYSLLKK